MSTAILFFTKTNSGGTDKVWVYDMQADGWSLDDKRQPLLVEDELGLQPLKDGRKQLSKEEHLKKQPARRAGALAVFTPSPAGRGQG